MTTHQIVAEEALTDLPDRIVVSPGHGRVVLNPPQSYTAEGEVVCAGDVIALVESHSEPVEVRAPCDGWVMSYLARDGERVRPGVPIVHLREV